MACVLRFWEQTLEQMFLPKNAASLASAAGSAVPEACVVYERRYALRLRFTGLTEAASCLLFAKAAALFFVLKAMPKIWRRLGAHSRPTACEESSKPTAAYLGRAHLRRQHPCSARPRPGCVCNGGIPGCPTLLRAITNHARRHV